MKCSVCGKAAKRYTIEKKNGEAVVELCESCYQKLYGTQDDLFYPKKGTILKECPSCGTTYEDFKRTGLLGCANCYKAFENELAPMLAYIHRKLQHEGKTPASAAEGYDDMRDLIARQDRLRGELDIAIKRGDGERVEAIKAGLARIRETLRRTDA